MGRVCTVCASEQRKAIDLALMLHQHSYRRIAEEYGVAETSLIRHEQNHLAMSWQLSKGLGAMLSAENMLEKLAELDEITRDILRESRDAGDNRLALSAVRESRGNIETFADIGIHREIRERVDALEERLNGGTHEPGEP